MEFLAIYAVVAVAIWIAMLVSLRSEPTAHGQIVGHQLGCIFSVFWPLLPFYLLLVVLPFMVASAWADRRCGRCRNLRLKMPWNHGPCTNCGSFK